MNRVYEVQITGYHQVIAESERAAIELMRAQLVADGRGKHWEVKRERRVK